MPHRPEDPQEDAQWRNAGDRIQNLLDASAASGAVAHERAEQLVREVTDLYGAGLERMMSMAVGANPELADRFVGDDLIASLLLVHGMHPHTVERRIEDALDSVRPYLGSHGGDVHLLEVDGEVVRLQFAGSCKSCPSSAVTLELAVEDAVRAAAPEISSIEVVTSNDGASEPTPAVIPANSLMSRVRTQPQGHAWHPVPDVADLTPGEVGGFAVAGTTVLACRVGDQLFAYHDRCGSCGESLAGAVLHRRLGSSSNDALLRCPRCHAHFDVVHAGACVDGNGSGPGKDGAHLEPIPLLERDGVLSMAVAEAVAS
jgi:Fe-S cluster biogenesis protein NfuA/nitrite reductase/ring-hydroxylating ferredoxin subunit